MFVKHVCVYLFLKAELMETKVQYFKTRRTKDRQFIKKIVDELKEQGYTTSNRYVRFVLDNERGRRFTELTEKIIVTAKVIDEVEEQKEADRKKRLQRKNK